MTVSGTSVFNDAVTVVGSSLTVRGAVGVGTGGDTNDDYLRIDDEDGAPPAGDCDANDESGRMIIDYTNDRLYICNQRSGRGWDYIPLTD